MWWKQNKWKVILPIAVIVILAAAFWYGGSAPGLQGWTVNEPDKTAQATPTAQSTGTPTPANTTLPTGPASAVPELTATPENVSETPEESPTPTPTPEVETPPPAESPSMVIDPNTGKDKYQTDPVPEGKPLPVEPQDTEITDIAHTCTLSISCATILDNMDWLDPEKVELVPEDGIIFPATAVTFYEGESVFNVLQRTCKQNRIHMEFSETLIYNSVYIEGIHNLYEFDCGEQSGWMFSVNGWFPNYGCSRYQLQDGDVVEWVYTCDLGYDVGGGFKS